MQSNLSYANLISLFNIIIKVLAKKIIIQIRVLIYTTIIIIYKIDIFYLFCIINKTIPTFKTLKTYQ